MKKLFALFLALALLFLTACNPAPPASSDGSGSSGNSSSDTPGNSPYQIVDRNSNHLIDIPSRIMFRNSQNFYYNKADGKAYLYCFDPICNHADYTCLANPISFIEGWGVTNTALINNRFYCMTQYGKIYSFSFDGNDKKLEYDAGYDADMLISKSIWRTMIAYGSYIYIDSKEYESPHTLRFNVETKTMEDLTEKTGNYIYPSFFCNGTIYGTGDNTVMVDAFYKTDLDLHTTERIETIPSDQYSGSLLIGYVYKERESINEQPRKIGISFYDMETGKQRIVTKEDLGLDYDPRFVAATEKYFYFYNPTPLDLGTVIVERPDGSQLTMKVQKMNDGKLYRMNLDGTNIVCVYDNPDYELNDNMVIYEDRVVMQGQYVAIENGKKKVWGGPLQVAVINEDGTFGEFREVEVVG